MGWPEVPERHKGKLRFFAVTTTRLGFLSALGSLLAWHAAPTFAEMQERGFSVPMVFAGNDFELSPQIGIDAAWQLLVISVLQFMVGAIAHRISR